MQQSIVFLVRVQCRRKESSRSLSHLLMSFLFNKLLLRNYVADFVEICNVCARKAIIQPAKRIINSDKVCHSYSYLNFGVTFWNTVYIHTYIRTSRSSFVIICCLDLRVCGCRTKKAL